MTDRGWPRRAVRYTSVAIPPSANMMTMTPGLPKSE